MRALMTLNHYSVKVKYNVKDPEKIFPVRQKTKSKES